MSMAAKWLAMLVKSKAMAKALILMKIKATQTQTSSNRLRAITLVLKLQTKNRLVNNKITTSTGLKDHQMININSKEWGVYRHNCSLDMTRLSRFWKGCALVPNNKSWWILPTETATKSTMDRHSDIRLKEILMSQVDKHISLLQNTLLCKTTGHLSERHRTWKVSCHISEERSTKLMEKLELVTQQLFVKFQVMLKFRRLIKIRQRRWEVMILELPWCRNLRLMKLSRVRRASMIKLSLHIDASSKPALISTLCLKLSSSEFQKCSKEKFKWKTASVT